MARKIEVTLYKFDELSDDAKEVARDWWRNGMEFAWGDESLDSIRAFCDQFGVKLKSWSIGPYSPIDYTLSEYDNSNFRGVKLKSLTRENYPTGYCLDADLSIAFYDTFKATGDVVWAFRRAVARGFHVWREDMEWQISDEAIDECLIANEYEFTESGRIA